MSDDPYSPPETDVQVTESLPRRPALGITFAFLFNFFSTFVIGLIFSFAIMSIVSPDAITGDEKADATARIHLVANLYYAQLISNLVVAFLAGFICVRVSRSARWRYPLILIPLSAVPTVLMMHSYDVTNYLLRLGPMALVAVAILIGARIAMTRLRKNSAAVKL